MIILLIFSSFLICALMEYLLHKYYLHKNSGHPHISKHHVLFHGKSSYENPNTSSKDIVSNLGYVFFSWLPCLLIGLFLYSFGLFYSSIFTATGLLYLLWVESSHYLFHKPEDFFFENLGIFTSLKEHHRIHHIDYQSNYGIGSSFWDRILKTKNKKSY